MESILDVFLLVLLGVVKLDKVGVVFGKDEIWVNILLATTNVWRWRTLEVALAKLRVGGLGDEFGDLLGIWFLDVVAPCPGVSEPYVRHDVELGCGWATVVGGDTEEQLIRVICLLGSLNEDIPVLVVLEDTSVYQVVLLFVS